MSKREITSKQCDKIDLPKRDPVPGLALTNSMTEQNLSPPDLFSFLLCSTISLPRSIIRLDFFHNHGVYVFRIHFYPTYSYHVLSVKCMWSAPVLVWLSSVFLT